MKGLAVEVLKYWCIGWKIANASFCLKLAHVLPLIVRDLSGQEGHTMVVLVGARSIYHLFLYKIVHYKENSLATLHT